MAGKFKKYNLLSIKGIFITKLDAFCQGKILFELKNNKRLLKNGGKFEKINLEKSGF